MSDVSYLILAMYAFCGRAQVIHALSLSWLFTMCNTALVSEGTGGGVWRYMVIVACFISVFSRSQTSKWKGRINKYVAVTLALSAFIAAHSLLISPVADVSLLKLISWLMVFVTLQVAWGGMLESEQLKTFAQLKFGLAAILLLSVPMLAIPSVGFRVNGEGFQGILNHPQTLGPIAAIACVITALQIFSTTKSQWSSVMKFLVAIVLVFLSEARTAGVALILALTISTFASPLINKVSLATALPGLKNRSTYAIVCIGLACLIAAAPLILANVSSFLFKRGETTNLFDAADASRGALVNKMLTNIEAKPLLGIGFGIASEPESMEIIRDPLLGLPVSAVVEKGVTPIAVWEELGIVGALLVLIWSLLFLMKAARNGILALAIALAVVFLNLGEATFFSVGGTGLILAVFFCAATANSKRVSAS